MHLNTFLFWGGRGGEGGRGGHDLKSMRTKHVRKNWKVNDKVQNVCHELSLHEEFDVHFAFQLIEFCFNKCSSISPREEISHYGVFNHGAQSDPWPWARGRNLHVALPQVQRPLLRL